MGFPFSSVELPREFAHLRDLKGVPTDVLTPATLPTEEPLKQLEEFLLELDDTATGGMVP